MRLWSSVGICVVIVASTCGSAQGREFRVYTCSAPDGRALGPTISADRQLVSGWSWSYTGNLDADLADQCPVSGPFDFTVRSGAMSAGQTIWARWTAAPGTDLVGVTMRWIGEATPRAD